MARESGAEKGPRLVTGWRRDDWSRWTATPDLTKREYADAAALTAELIAVAALRESARNDPYPTVEGLALEGGSTDSDLMHPLAG
jgi:hypothetical protein